MAPRFTRRRQLVAPLAALTAGLAAGQTPPAAPTTPVRIQVQPLPTQPKDAPAPKDAPPPTPDLPPGSGAPALPPGAGASGDSSLPPGAGASGGSALPPGAGASGNVSPAAGVANSGAPSVGNSAATAPAANATTAQAAPAGSTTSVVSGGGGAAGAAQNATSSADLLSRSPATTGVEVQRKNSVVADPRVRGLRSSQFTTTADGGLFLPARLDLDTAITKFDPGSVRQIGVVKGPYSALYGPGFSHIDLQTLASPRYTNGCFETHGRTAAGYQTNGNRWDLLQSVDGGDDIWGFRVTYNNATGNDYRSGDGTRVPSSFTSNTVNFAVGVNLTDKSSLELHGLSTVQNNLEFPGLYFDIRQSTTDAYSLRYTLDDQGIFDRLTLDVWYNATASSGDTRNGAKQDFVQKLLGVSFNPTLFPSAPGVAPTGNQLALTSPLSALAARPGVNLFRDDSTTRFSGRSIGYRLATNWGPKDDPYVTLGTDLNAFGQQLQENIRIQQLGGTNLATGLPVTPGDAPLTQDQSIPASNQVNPGIFLQAKAPLTARWTVRSGGRIDWVHSSSDPRLINGNFNLFGPANQTVPPPLGAVVPGVAAVGPYNLDPLVYSANTRDANLSRNDLLAAGFLSSEYKLDDNWTSVFAFGHSQRAPSLTELYASGPFVGVLQQGTSRLIGDPNLHAEHLTQIDFGLRAEYDRLTLGGNAYYSWINNYITYDANRLSPGLTQVVYTNTDLATIAGAEVFAQADVTDWLTPFGTLAYTQGVDQTAGDRRRADTLDSSRRDDPLTLRRKGATEPLPQISPLESRVGFRIHQPGKAPRWQVEFNARMVSGQTLVATSLGELATPGFTVFNIRGFVKLTDNLLVSAGVDNLGDRNYREHLDPISGNILGTGALLRPGANFFFNTQLTY